MKEDILKMGPYGSLIGVLTHADQADNIGPDDLCVLMLNSGLIHHVGPHRLHVDLARELAVNGIYAVRADLSGIGDSLPRPDDVPATQLAAQEPREMIDSLQSMGFRNFVIFGICSGAKHALLAVEEDDRIDGLVLVNQESTENSTQLAEQVSAQHYLRRSMWSPSAWFNLFTGRVRYGLLFKSLGRALWRKLRGVGKRNRKTVDPLRKELAPALRQKSRILALFSDRHAALAASLEAGLSDMISSGKLELGIYPDTDHLFTDRKSHDLLIKHVCRWVTVLHGRVKPVIQSAVQESAEEQRIEEYI